MSKIPEVIDLDTQRLKLIATFGGNMDFRNIRGKCGGDFLAVTDARMENGDGTAMVPSAGVGNLKYFLTSFANVRGKIAQLNRDGFTLAAHEAREALERPGYRMLGETEPFEVTIPITLVMFNPRVTLKVLAQKHTREPHWCKIEEVPKEVPIPSYRNYGGIIAYKDLLDSLHDLNERMFGKLKERPGKHIHHRDMYHSVVLPNVPKDQSSKLAYGTVFACYATKSNVLRRFTKKEQEQITIWQFNLPKMYAGQEEHHLYFGLHKQEEHARWQRIRAPFCSEDILHGYGAIAYPGEAYHCFDERSKKFEGTRILLTS